MSIYSGSLHEVAGVRLIASKAIKDYKGFIKPNKDILISAEQYKRLSKLQGDAFLRELKTIQLYKAPKEFSQDFKNKDFL